MKRLRMAIIGFGRIGWACGRTILGAEDLALAGLVRRPGQLGAALPPEFQDTLVTAHISELTDVDAALVCVPTDLAGEILHELAQHRMPAVDGVELHGAALRRHAEEIHRVALRHRVPVVVGAGWDPGALSLIRHLFALLIPTGGTEVHTHVGAALHHTLTARAIAGVRDALCTERRSAEGRVQRYVYVELEAGADTDRVVQAIRGDPLFLDEETLVFPVDDLGVIIDEDRGILVERRGTSAWTAHQYLMLEGRFDRAAVTAETMVAAARALPALSPGAHRMPEVPLDLMWGVGRGEALDRWT
ncbi:diaminopimelate dehydrogenase [Skermanella aerolata]|uniref:hypothetical protein n=1 Tax=Skermanella aerolata TaxID=393310 RepID=UPI003D20A8FC